MKIYLIAGETSGDIHGADLIRQILLKNSDTSIRAVGGPKMSEVGATIAFDYRESAIMGFVEVLKNIRKLRQHFKLVEEDIRQFKPDKIVMIDYPGFNLRLAKKIYATFDLYYYIAPKAWAWNSKRSHKLAKYFKKVYSILPFETDFFHKYGVAIQYVGNPSKSQVERFLESNKTVEESDHIALFPGSRKQEIERILPIMLDALRRIPNIKYKISQAPSLDRSIYEPFLDSKEDLVVNNYELLRTCKMALVTSGTATLETALFGVPQIVCYVGSNVSVAIAKRLVKLKFISLVNIILDRAVVCELIQKECTPDNIIKEINALQSDQQRITRIKTDYDELKELLGNQNSADIVSTDILFS